MRLALVLLLFSLTVGRLCRAQAPSDAAQPQDVARWVRPLTQRLGLPDLRRAPAEPHVRLWMAGSVLDLWRPPNGAALGQLTLWTEEAGTPVPTHRLHVRRVPLPPAQVQQLLALVDSTRILAVPTQEAIAAWKATFDGRLYVLEFAGAQGYGAATWANPQVQGPVPEAVRVAAFVARADALVQSAARWQAFQMTIPYPCFSSNGGSSVACRVYPTQTRKQRRQEHPLSDPAR